MSLANHLVLFVRAPVMGRVKTRLAADIGAVAAWAFYRRGLDALLRRLAPDPRWRCWLAVAPDGAVRRRRLWPPRCRRLAQGPGDLGRRMGAVARALPPGPVVIVGADVPGIRRRHVAAAFRALGRHDAVFGPARDGGYWLVGLSRRPSCRDVFGGVRWSTGDALADTVANVARTADAGGGRTHALLETLEDVDDGAAYRRWRAARRRRG